MPDRDSGRLGVLVAVGAAIGSGIGAITSMSTANWTWMPVAVGVSIGLSATAIWMPRR